MGLLYVDSKLGLVYPIIDTINPIAIKFRNCVVLGIKRISSTTGPLSEQVTAFKPIPGELRAQRPSHESVHTGVWFGVGIS